MKISPDDKAKVDELRALVKEHLTPYYDTDFNLLRWLVGHDYNLEVIKPKLINHLLLRRFEEWQLDTVADKPRDHPIHSHWKSGLTATAELTPNTIVNVEQSGSNDYWGLLQCYPTNEILKARVHDLESMQRAVMKMEKETGERCSILYFMDLSGLKMDRQLTTLITGALSAISAFMSEHYVELIHSFVLVNAPSFIHTLWTLARPLLPERTTKKVKILGGNWRQEVLELAVPSALPSFWNEPDSTTFSYPLERGVPFPPELFYKDAMPADADTLIVKAGRTGYIEKHVKENERLRFELTGDGQFAFTVFFFAGSPEEAAEVDTLQWPRAYPQFNKIPGPTIVPMKDEFRCPRTGTYRAWFSNEHAWFHTLKISFVFSIA